MNKTWIEFIDRGRLLRFAYEDILYFEERDGQTDIYLKPGVTYITVKCDIKTFRRRIAKMLQDSQVMLTL